MVRFRVQKNWISSLLMGGVPLVAVWVAVGMLAQRGRSLVVGSETGAVEQMISLAVVALAIVAASVFLPLWSLGNEPVNCSAHSSGVLFCGSAEASAMFDTITSRVSSPGNVQITLAALPVLTYSTELTPVSWQSLRALKRVYLFHEVRLRPQVAVAFGGGSQAEEVLIVGNPLELGRFVRGILDNVDPYALDAMVWVEVSKADCKSIILIEGDGPRIAPDGLDPVFERGMRGIGARARGEGLCLANARNRTNKRGWEIFAEERSGEWSRVLVGFPAPAELRV